MVLAQQLPGGLRKSTEIRNQDRLSPSQDERSPKYGSGLLGAAL